VSSLASVHQRAAAFGHARRASGQMGALAGKIAAADPFSEVAQQLLAARGSLDSVHVRLVVLELRNCLPSQEARDVVDGLLRTALGRSMPGRNAARARRGRPTTPLPDPQYEERTSR